MSKKQIKDTRKRKRQLFLPEHWENYSISLGKRGDFYIHDDDQHEHTLSKVDKLGVTVLSRTLHLRLERDFFFALDNSIFIVDIESTTMRRLEDTGGLHEINFNLDKDAKHVSLTPTGDLLFCYVDKIILLEDILGTPRGSQIYLQQVVDKRCAYRTWMLSNKNVWLSISSNYRSFLFLIENQQSILTLDCGYTSFAITPEGRIFTQTNSEIIEIYYNGTVGIVAYIHQSLYPCLFVADFSGIYYATRQTNEIRKLMFPIEWTRKIHYRLSSMDKQRIVALFSLSLRNSSTDNIIYPHCGIAWLPKDILLCILGMVCFHF